MMTPPEPESTPEEKSASLLGWAVTIAALAVLAILFSYDAMFGIAFGVLIAVVALAQLALSAWLSSDEGELKSKPGSMVLRRVRSAAANSRLSRLRARRLRSER